MLEFFLIFPFAQEQLLLHVFYSESKNSSGLGQVEIYMVSQGFFCQKQMPKSILCKKLFWFLHVPHPLKFCYFYVIEYLETMYYVYR